MYVSKGKGEEKKGVKGKGRSVTWRLVCQYVKKEKRIKGKREKEIL